MITFQNSHCFTLDHATIFFFLSLSLGPLHFFLKNVHHKLIPVNHLGVLSADSDLVNYGYGLRFDISNKLPGNECCWSVDLTRI